MIILLDILGTIILASCLYYLHIVYKSSLDEKDIEIDKLNRDLSKANIRYKNLKKQKMEVKCISQKKKKNKLHKKI